MEITFSVDYLSWTKDRIIFQFMVFIFLHHAIRTAVIPFKEDTCGLRQKLRNQFSEFRPEHSAEEYEFLYDKGTSLTFELSFCTLTRRAIIAKMKNIVSHQTLFIQILEGALALSIEQSENSQPECEYYLGNNVVNDGSLHSIEIGISPGLLRAQAYHQYRPLGNEKSLNYSHCVTNGMFLSGQCFIEIGGDIVHRFPNNKVQVLYSFTGCITNVRLNRRPVENAAKKIASSDVGNECLTFQNSCVDICPPTSKFQGGFCVCPIGTKLDRNDVCWPTCDCVKCQNGGTCYTTALGAWCACPDGYSGSHCQLLLDFCADITCFNGSCETDGDSNSFKCICYPGFTGISCNESVDACFGVLCQNGGTCHSNPTNYSENLCKCPAGYSGKFCDEAELATKDKKLLVRLAPKIPGIVILGLFILAAVWIVLKMKRLHSAREGTPAQESSFCIPESGQPALIKTEEPDINGNKTTSGISLSKECEEKNLKNSEEATGFNCHDERIYEISNINNQQHWGNDDKDATPSVTSASCDNEQTTDEEGQPTSVNPQTENNGVSLNPETENDGVSVNPETDIDEVNLNPETDSDVVSVNSDTYKYRINANSGADKSGGSENSETHENGTNMNPDPGKDGISVNSDTYKYRINVNQHTDKDGVSENSDTDKDRNSVSCDTNKGGVSVNSDIDNDGGANVQIESTDKLYNDSGSIHMDTLEENEHHESAELEYHTISTEPDDLNENDSSEKHTSNNENNDNVDDPRDSNEIFV